MQKTPKLSYVSPTDRLLKKAVINSIEQLTGRHKLEKMYATALQNYGTQTSFWEAAISALQLKLVYDQARLAAIPEQGPIVFIANHPYGVLDGLVLCHLAAQTRRNFKILIMAGLCREERIAAHMLPIDFSETDAAVRVNVETKRQALETLRQGGAVVIFPAGGIATSRGLLGQAVDLEWKLFAAKLIQMTQATVVPIYFHGQNSRLFQIISQFSLTLRLSLIIREVNKKIAQTLPVTIGEPIPYTRLAHIKSRRELTAYLRNVVYLLGGRHDAACSFSKFESKTRFSKLKRVAEKEFNA